MSNKYLKPWQYYSDLYDRFTVEECRRWEKRGVSKDWDSIKDSESKKNKIKKEFTVEIIGPTVLYFVKGDRYVQKAETIRKWMDRDRALDEKLENAVAPDGILCLICGAIMEVTIKHLHSKIGEKEDRVFFFFECPSCGKRRAFFEGGEEWKPTPMKCSKCQGSVKTIYKKRGKKITTIYKCLSCGHKEVDVLDLNKKEKPEKIDSNFEADRKKFCLSLQQGQEYIEAKTRLENASKLLEGTNGRARIQKELAKIKKLTVVGLRGLLTPAIEKENYIKIDFSKPEMGRDIIINFTVQDNKAGRCEYDSRIQLQKVLKLTLLKTNWRLMSEGTHYRLGILSGRLRGYESEEDLLKLVESRGRE